MSRLGIFASSMSSGLPVSGATLWLDASDATTFSYSSGSLVSQWSDKSGAGNDFTQSTVGTQPTRTANLQNGLPGVQFRPGGGTNFKWLGRTWDWAASQNTTFIVLKILSGYYQAAFSAGVNGTLSYAIDNGQSYAIFKNGIAPYTYNLVATLSNADVAVWKSTAVSSGSVTTYFYKNGTAASGTQTITGLSTSSSAQVGAATTVESITQYICEVIYYPSQLSDANRNLVEAYLKAKWGTP